MTRQFAFCVLAVALLIPCGCGKKAPAVDSASRVKLMLDWRPEPEFGGFYAATLKGAPVPTGLAVDVQSAGEGEPMWQLVANGQTDYATTSADQVLIARERGADVMALFAVYQTCPLGIMVHPERGFTQIGDVFTHEGTLAMENRPWLTYCVDRFGPVKVTLTDFSGGISAYLAKPNFSEQCYLSSEPVEVRHQGGKAQAFLMADIGYNPYTTVVVTRGERVRTQPAQVRAMIDWCRAGWRAYLDDPAPANVEMHKLTPQMDEQSFAEAAKVQKPLIETDPAHPASLGTMTAERWVQLAQQLQKMKVLTKVPPATECFVTADQLK